VSEVASSFRRDWNRLWGLAEKLSTAPGRPQMFAECDAATIFGFAGLFLEPPSDPGDWSDYVNSPRNAITFASTGGDGTHFCALFGPADAVATPVILSVPLADQPNLVVGASLPEFLALGCATGYHLDDLAYDTRDRMLHELQTVRTPDDPDRAYLLAALVEEFDLAAWPDVASRLDELDDQYAGDVVWSPWVG
jgi:hypothetical protein